MSRRPLIPVRKCPGPCKNRTPLGRLCGECHHALLAARAAYPLPPKPSHPVFTWSQVTPEGVTDEDLARYVEADAPYEQACRAHEAARTSTYDRAVQAVVAVLGIDHPAVRVLARNRPAYREENPGARLRRYVGEARATRQREQAVKAAQQGAVVAERAKAARAFLDKARVDLPPLLAFGDYVQAPAAAAGVVEFAQRYWLSSQQERTLFHGDGFVADFAGRTACSEQCQGWDGKSHRCECGAHRVCWDHEGDFDEPNSYVYGRTC